MRIGIVLDPNILPKINRTVGRGWVPRLLEMKNLISGDPYHLPYDQDNIVDSRYGGFLSSNAKLLEIRQDCDEKVLCLEWNLSSRIGRIYTKPILDVSLLNVSLLLKPTATFGTADALPLSPYNDLSSTTNLG